MNPDGEDNVDEHITIEQLAYDVANVANDDLGECASFSEQDEDADSVPDVERQLECLAVAKSSLERHSVLSLATRKAFLECQRELRLEKQQSMRQTTIFDHFKAS